MDENVCNPPPLVDLKGKDRLLEVITFFLVSTPLPPEIASNCAP